VCLRADLRLRQATALTERAISQAKPDRIHRSSIAPRA
jgi:hypothetical protein